MKILILSLITAFYMPLVFAGNGSFLILKSTYLFQESNRSGKKTLTRVRQAYEVTNLYAPKGETLMFQIEFDKKFTAINGSGFIVETESELKELGLSEVKVYAEIPAQKNDLTNYQLVPSNQLSFTGRVEKSADFPNLSWKAVNFKTQAPLYVWVPEWAGIYRPDKDADWLNKTFQAANSKGLDKDLLEKILNGQVETGYTKDQVRMALGNPVKEQMIENDSKLEWIYNSRKVIFVNGVVSRVL